MIGKINKSELLNKIQNLHPNDVKKLGLTNDEINFIKNRLLNDKLGLQLNFSEIDEKLEQNYLGLKDKGGGLSFNLKEKNNNLLIEGENFHALKALLIANVKVNIIYIDPPYNTGKEFIYNDNYTSLDKNNIVNKDDQFKHSK
ncbi:MAG: DNA adenine methylase [Bacilli bacterium]